MSSFLDLFNQTVTAINSVLWHPWVLYVLLAIGILLTLWSGFSQYRSLTHGSRVVLGHYDDADDPGAISHFQALSAALSATVGIGNIGGVALAIALGGPGAVLWMWLAGLLGMALKTTEVTLAMLYRQTSDRTNPHGGPMWVAARGLAKARPALARLGKPLATLFCVTLLISTLTGGNFFQAWNTGTITQQYFAVPAPVVGLVLSLLVAMVIVGGITRIGAVAGLLVPFMCGAYLLAAIAVLVLRHAEIPEIFALIVHSAFHPLDGQGAFLGAGAGLAFSVGLQRAFFSNEAGQGSSPIAHSAARTDEPAREGLVAGLEPFIDTLVVCTLTALVILASGAWNRGPELRFPSVPEARATTDDAYVLTAETPPPRSDRPWRSGDQLQVQVRADDGAPRTVTGTVALDGGEARIEWMPFTSSQPPVVEDGVYLTYTGAALTAHAFDRVVPGLGKWLVTLATWLFALSTMISWSYYGEQGVVYLLGDRWVLFYKLIFCAVIVVSCSGLVRNTAELNNLSLLGTGVMLFANLPITLLLAYQAVGTLKDYDRRMKGGDNVG